MCNFNIKNFQVNYDTFFMIANLTSQWNISYKRLFTNIIATVKKNVFVCPFISYIRRFHLI